MSEATKAGHTPGPWAVVQRARSTVISAVSGVHVALIWREETSVNFTRESAAPNARLIAAAPDLLAALRLIQDGFRDGSIKWAKPRQCASDPYHPANTAMCAAIAKAEVST